MSAVLAHYQRHAAEVGARHASLSFDAVHADLLPWLPEAPARILDVGAGVGRDALTLSQLGYRVSAVEPSTAMREAGERRTVGAVDWKDDSLPLLEGTTAGATRYDFVLCSAVLMHVRPESLPASLGAMSALLTPTGRLAVTLRAPQPGDPSDVFFDHSDQALLHGAASAGLERVASGRNADSFARPLVWRWFVFQKR
ncbi:MAG: class I SAM-dependent methyltransferase [Caulobacterales bacterium]|nr:class I SAM-dependent methyltransferase [Caulobacterales bacterium]